MKKLLMLLLLVFVFSCEKVEDYCWDCVQIKTDFYKYKALYNPFTMCNKTEEEIRDIENTYTYIVCGLSSVTKCVPHEEN